MNRTKKLVLTALFTACAIVVNIAESALPMPLPGLKLGAANVFALAALVLMGPKEAFAVTVLRVFLSWLMTGNWFAFICGITGGLAAASAMSLLWCGWKKEFTLPWISIAGAWAFNIGQTAAAAVIVGDARVIFYIAPLFIAGTAAGWATGWLAQKICERLGGKDFEDSNRQGRA